MDIYVYVYVYIFLYFVGKDFHIHVKIFEVDDLLCISAFFFFVCPSKAKIPSLDFGSAGV